jgi:type VI secretion system protein ImpA
MDARMAEIDLAALTGPVAEGEPCGPDLDLSGDADYMNFVAKAENLIPSSFFAGPDGRPFDRSAIDFAAEFTAMQPLLARTRDIRLLVILAKLSVLNRDLVGFESAVCAIQELLKQRWDEVHPRGHEDVFNARTAALETLDDLPQVIFPLQYTPFVHHPRIGQIGYRNYMIATGEVPAREGEGAHDLTAIENALMEADLAQLVEARGRFEALRTALADIRRVCTDEAGFEQAPKLERLPALVDKIRSLLNDVIVKRDPTSALETASSVEGVEPGADAAPIGELRSLADVADALAAIADYFVCKEPSNPALLLVRQAEQLMGKSFVEVMQILVPKHVEEAAIYIGKEQPLQLPIARLSELISFSGESSSANGDTGVTPARCFEAKTRADAVRLLEQIGAYYRAVEPSSPLPHLTDRARDLAGRDFLSLLKHVLPTFNADA